MTTHGGHGNHPSDGHHDQQHHPHRHGRLRSMFVPHSHDSADAVDDELEGSALGIRAVKTSLVVLGVTALVQGVIVLGSGSVALPSSSSSTASALSCECGTNIERRRPCRCGWCC